MNDEQRCQWAADTPTLQCILSDGHDGQHIHRHQVEEQRRRNLHPTLEDIRQVVREEIRAARLNGAEHAVSNS